MWHSCIAVLDPKQFIAILFYQEQRLELQCTHVTFQDGSPQENQWSKQIAWLELYTQNYQIWAADVNASLGKLLFEIIITGQLRFPLIANYTVKKT